MLKTIELQGYRGFDDYRVGGLTRVNLLVGENNCGKTSVLEAAQLLASGGDPRVLSRVAWRRGEVAYIQQDPPLTRRAGLEQYSDISHFFHGHNFGPGSAFRLSSGDGFGELNVRVLLSRDLNNSEMQFDATLFPELALQIEGHRPPLRFAHAYLISRQGTLALDVLERQKPFPRSRNAPSVEFVAPDSLKSRFMAEIWDQALLEGREDEAISAMRLLEPRIEDITFLSARSASRRAGPAGILVGLKDERRRVPLGSMGDGMRRLLGLSLALIRTSGGVLLVDEIDTGLHWSIMGSMWRLVVLAAVQSQVQVFATTQSLDCVRGLAWLCESFPSLGSEVSLQKIDRSLDEAVSLPSDKIRLAVEQDIEVR